MQITWFAHREAFLGSKNCKLSDFKVWIFTVLSLKFLLFEEKEKFSEFIHSS